MVGAVGKILPGPVDNPAIGDNSLIRKGNGQTYQRPSEPRPRPRSAADPVSHRPVRYLPRTPALVAPSRDAPDRIPPTTRAEGRVPTTVAYCSRTSR